MRLCLLAALCLCAHAQQPFADLARLFDNPAAGASATLTLEAKPDQQGVRVFELSFPSPVDASNVPGLLVMPAATAATSSPVVLFGHWMMPGSPLRNRNEFLDEAVVLARAGAICVLLDSPLIRPGFVDDPDPMHGQWASATVQMTREWRRALDLVLARFPNADAKRIAYVGHSFHAGVGARLAGVEKRIQTLVLMASAFSLRDLVYGEENREFRSKNGGDELYRDYFAKFPHDDPEPFVRYSAPAAIFVQAGADDRDPAPAAVRKSFAYLQKPKRLAVYTGAGHALDAAARMDRVRWLAKRLRLKIDEAAVRAIPQLR